MKRLVSFLICILILLEAAYAVTPYDLVVVREDNPTDYVIISPYTFAGKVPILFVSPDELTKDQLNQTLSYYKNEAKILIIGGRDAISDDIEERLQDIGYSTTRLWDFDRYGTAARVAIDLWIKSDEAVIVDGKDTKNHLNAQKLALERGLPILFSSNGELPESAKAALEIMGTKRLYAFEDLNAKGYNVVRLTTSNVVFIEKEEKRSSLPYILGGLVIILLAFVSYLWYKKSRVPSTFLTEEEKIIVTHIKNGVKQNELPHLTGYSKPKVSRILQLMEDRDIIERKKEKKTYIVKLKVDIL